MKYEGSLFGYSKKTENPTPQTDTSKLLELQLAELKKTYKSECLDAKQLQQVLNVGEESAYNWLKQCKHTRAVRRRKVVPIIWVANYLVNGEL